MTIRNATSADMPAVLELIKELARFEREPDAVRVTVEDLCRDGFGENPLFRVVVAELDAEVCGMALFYHRYSTWKGKTIHLEDLVVRVAQRGIGIGQALFDAVMSSARSEGVRRVEWQVLDWNRNAIAFYAKQGARVLGDWRVVHLEMDK